MIEKASIRNEVLNRPIGEVITDLRGSLEAADKSGNIVNVVGHAYKIGVLEQVVDYFSDLEYKLTGEGK